MAGLGAPKIITMSSQAQKEQEERRNAFLVEKEERVSKEIEEILKRENWVIIY